MRKVCFFLILAAVFSAAAAAQGRNLCIEGAAVTTEQKTFFIDNFTVEAVALGYTITTDRSESAFTFKFEIVPNMVTYDDGTTEQAPPDEKQFLITIRLINNADNSELISLGFYFTQLEEMYEYNQTLLIRTLANIPAGAQGSFASGGATVSAAEIAAMAKKSAAWQNKWLYVRLSFDFPITFYQVIASDELVGKVGVYDGDFDNPIRVSPLENTVIAAPGMTAGLEVQFLNWMSLEANFQVSLGDMQGYDFINMAVGGQLKFPVKLTNLVMEPYAAAVYSLNEFPSRDFATFPLLGIGAGIQVASKIGPGSPFIDINYLYYLGEVGRLNPYGELYPKPEVINYQRSALGIGIGYKMGFFSR
jgi:hypothetical protein